MRRPTLLAALSLALFLLPATAPAATGRFELTPSVGYRLVGDIEVEDVRVFTDDLEVDESSTYGLFFDIPLNRWLQLEIMANRQDSELLADGGLFGREVVLADVEITYVHVGLLWQWGSGQVSPYVVGSLGLAQISPELPGVSDEDRPSLSFGGGVKVFFSDNVGLRLEGRGYYVALDDDDDDRWEDEDSLTQAEASVGLIFAW